MVSTFFMQLFMLCLVFAVLFQQVPSQAADIVLGQGMMAGEVSKTSVILQTRLTQGNQLINGDLPGNPGKGRFRISTSPSFGKRDKTTTVIETVELHALPANDCILKARVTGLEPNTLYYWQCVYVPKGESRNRYSSVCRFKTLAGKEVSQAVSFVVVTGMNYHFFHHGYYDNPERIGIGFAYSGTDKQLGYPALASILRLEPDFFIGTGDNVYYDHPGTISMQSRGITPPLGGWYGSAKTAAELRRKYHEQFVQQRFIDLFSKVSTYWQKDDHDYRFDDSDPYMDAARYREGDGLPSHDLGVRMFLEQLPVADPKAARPITFRTYRVNKLLQIWIVEGRDYRSPNNMPDGPDKSLWGAAQKGWLKGTLLASDATFKILVSPTPMVGPQGSGEAPYWKMDNHLNSKGFKHEGDEFFDWLVDHQFKSGNFFIVAGDSHWQYHAAHPSGFEEFTCGALVTANAQVGVFPDNSETTDPEGMVKHLFHPKQASGGFLQITVENSREENPNSIKFVFRNAMGKELYSVKKEAR